MDLGEVSQRPTGVSKHQIKVRIVAIDPGTKKSGYCVLRTGLSHGLNVEKVAKLPNDQIMARIRHCDMGNTHVVIESLSNQGGTFGYDLIETGYTRSLEQTCEDHRIPCFIYRRFQYGRYFVTEGKLNDASLRAALETQYGPSAKKNDPHFLKGASDKRSAFALAKYEYRLIHGLLLPKAGVKLQAT